MRLFWEEDWSHNIVSMVCQIAVCLYHYGMLMGCMYLVKWSQNKYIQCSFAQSISSHIA